MKDKHLNLMGSPAHGIADLIPVLKCLFRIMLTLYLHLSLLTVQTLHLAYEPRPPNRSYAGNHSQTALFVFACFYSKGSGQDRTLGYTQAGQMLVV